MMQALVVQRDIVRDLARFDYLARRVQLLQLGHSPGAIRRGVSAGSILSPRRGWLCTSDAPTDASRAVQLGGRLGGSSALRSYGVWADETDLIVATPSNASRLPALNRGERRVWLDDRFPQISDRQWRVSVLDALLQHASLVDRPSLVASVDSALNSRQLTPASFAKLIETLPAHLRRIRHDVDGRSMSGTESKLRLACIAAGLRVELQASIDRVGLVDLLVDGWLIVEVDSRQFHDEQIAQHRDRVRDGNAVLGNYGNLRFDYQLVQFELDWCIEVILVRLKSGRP